MVGFSLTPTLASHLLFKLDLTPHNPFSLILGAGTRLRRGAARGGVSYLSRPLYVSR